MQMDHTEDFVTRPAAMQADRVQLTPSIMDTFGTNSLVSVVKRHLSSNWNYFQ